MVPNRKQIVLLLHGVGADGDDLINLATYFGKVLPKAVFIAPNAPFRFDRAGPWAFSGFPSPARPAEQKLEGVKMAAPILNALIDHLLVEYGLDESKMAIVGFSQGTMMALHVGPRRVKPVAGIIGYSGSLVGSDLLASEIKSKPPVLLMHGNMDPIVPPGPDAPCRRYIKIGGRARGGVSVPQSGTWAGRHVHPIGYGIPGGKCSMSMYWVWPV